MSTTTKIITADELFAMGDIGRCELIQGEIIHMAPAGAEHGDIANNLAVLISVHTKNRRLGKVFAAETGFIIARNPDTVRAPDVAFLRADRIPNRFTEGYFPGAPDLAVEVVSPNDTASEVAIKVAEWLAAGVTSVWVVDPAPKSIVIYRGGNEAHHYQINDRIVDEPMLPGFEMDVRAAFEG